MKAPNSKHQAPVNHQPPIALRIEKVAPAFSRVAQTFEKVAQTFGTVAQTFGTVAQTFGTVAQTFGTVAQTFEKVAQTFQSAVSQVFNLLAVGSKASYETALSRWGKIWTKAGRRMRSVDQQAGKPAIQQVRDLRYFSLRYLSLRYLRLRYTHFVL